MMLSLLCRIIGHKFGRTAEAKRWCVRCNREEWLFSREFPKIGEAKYFWQRVDWDRRL